LDPAAEAEAIIATKREVTYKYYSENIYDAGDIKPSSLTRENGLNNTWIIPAIGAVRIADVGDLHIKKVIHKMTKAEQSPRSVQYALGVIRKIINHAIGDSYFHRVTRTHGSVGRREPSAPSDPIFQIIFAVHFGRSVRQYD